MKRAARKPPSHSPMIVALSQRLGRRRAPPFALEPQMVGFYRGKHRDDPIVGMPSVSDVPRDDCLQDLPFPPNPTLTRGGRRHECPFGHEISITASIDGLVELIGIWVEVGPTGRVELRIKPLELFLRGILFREGVAHHAASPSCASTRSASSAMAPTNWGRNARRAAR